MSAPAAAPLPELTPAEREKERSVRFGLLADCVLLSGFFIVALIGGSFTLLAECIRAVPMNILEAGSFMALRRIHRRQYAGLDYGIGKLEQLLNVAIGIGMLGGAVWILVGGVQILAGERQVASPIGLTAAAIANAVNLLLNFMVWEVVRRAAMLERSVIMQGQLASRRAKLVSSVVIQGTMTMAALSMDPLVAAWADVAGSFFVAYVVIHTAMGLLGGGVSDLLDRTANPEIRGAIGPVLGGHAQDFVRLDRVRSRRSGVTIFIEVALAFAPELPVSEVHRRSDRLRQALQGAVPGAEVAVLIAAADP